MMMSETAKEHLAIIKSVIKTGEPVEVSGKYGVKTMLDVDTAYVLRRFCRTLTSDSKREYFLELCFDSMREMVDMVFDWKKGWLTRPLKPLF